MEGNFTKEIPLKLDKIVLVHILFFLYQENLSLTNKQSLTDDQRKHFVPFLLQKKRNRYKITTLQPKMLLPVV